MPNSDLFLTKENPDEDVSIKPVLQSQKHHLHESVPNCSQSTAISDLVARRNSSQSHSTAQKGKKKGAGGYEAAGPLSLLLSKENYKVKVEEQEEENEEDEEEDGFRTPTSLDHRIPEFEQCPPAPRKPKPSLKRKAPHTHTWTPIYLSSKEVQLLFPVQHNPLPVSHRITKKVPRDDSK